MKRQELPVTGTVRRMFTTPASDLLPVARTNLIHAAGMLTLAILIGLYGGCARTPRDKADVFTGAFSGVTADGRVTRWTFEQDDNVLVGRGVVGDERITLSGLVGWYGPVAFASDGGVTRQGRVTMALDGSTVTIEGLESPLSITRGGDPLPAAEPGAFAGRYVLSGGSYPVWLRLTQAGELLAGTGFVNGAPVAVVGKVTGTREASGTVLYVDGSRNTVSVTLSASGRKLTVQGLGQAVELNRR